MSNFEYQVTENCTDFVYTDWKGLYSDVARISMV